MMLLNACETGHLLIAWDDEEALPGNRCGLDGRTSPMARGCGECVCGLDLRWECVEHACGNCVTYQNETCSDVPAGVPLGRCVNQQCVCWPGNGVNPATGRCRPNAAEVSIVDSMDAVPFLDGAPSDTTSVTISALDATADVKGRDAPVDATDARVADVDALDAVGDTSDAMSPDHRDSVDGDARAISDQSALDGDAASPDGNDASEDVSESLPDASDGDGDSAGSCSCRVPTIRWWSTAEHGDLSDCRYFSGSIGVVPKYCQTGVDCEAERLGILASPDAQTLFGTSTQYCHAGAEPFRLAIGDHELNIVACDTAACDGGCTEVPQNVLDVISVLRDIERKGFSKCDDAGNGP